LSGETDSTRPAIVLPGWNATSLAAPCAATTGRIELTGIGMISGTGQWCAPR
jgi:hypothetical protein